MGPVLLAQILQRGASGSVRRSESDDLGGIGALDLASDWEAVERNVSSRFQET